MSWVEYNVGLSWIEFEFKESWYSNSTQGGEMVLKFNSKNLSTTVFFLPCGKGRRRRRPYNLQSRPWGFLFYRSPEKKSVGRQIEEEWVLITTCKQLVWSTRIVRNMPIWILCLILGSVPGATLSVEVTGCGCVACSIQGSRATLGRSIYYLSYYNYLIYLSSQDSPSSSFWNDLV